MAEVRLKRRAQEDFSMLYFPAVDVYASNRHACASNRRVRDHGHVRACAVCTNDRVRDDANYFSILKLKKVCL